VSHVLSDCEVRARKKHRCDQCDRAITPGTVYRRVVHTYDGFFTYTAHLDCESAAQHYAEYHDLGHDDGVHLRNDIAREDEGWLIPIFPEVARRLWPDRIFPEERV